MSRRLRNLRATCPSLRGSNCGKLSPTQAPTAACCPHPFLTTDPYPVLEAPPLCGPWPTLPAESVNCRSPCRLWGFLGEVSQKVNLISNRFLSWFPEASINLRSAVFCPPGGGVGSRGLCWSDSCSLAHRSDLQSTEHGV